MTSQSDIEAMARRLERLEDEAAIRRLVNGHQWAADAGGTDGPMPGWSAPDVESSAEPLAEWQQYWQAGGGVWRRVGNRIAASAEFQGAARIANAQSRPNGMPRMMHFLTNERIDVADSSSAAGQWYSWEAATVRDEDRALVPVWIAGRYRMTFVKENGEWRISSQEFERVFVVRADRETNWTSSSVNW